MPRYVVVRTYRGLLLDTVEVGDDLDALRKLSLADLDPEDDDAAIYDTETMCRADYMVGEYGSDEQGYYTRPVWASSVK